MAFWAKPLISKCTYRRSSSPILLPTAIHQSSHHQQNQKVPQPDRDFPGNCGPTPMVDFPELARANTGFRGTCTGPAFTQQQDTASANARIPGAAQSVHGPMGEEAQETKLLSILELPGVCFQFATGPPASPHQCRTHRCSPRSPSNGNPKTASPGPYPGGSRNRKSLLHSAFSLTKPWSTCSLSRRPSNSMPILYS